jgi:hypothetical protein
LRGKQWPTFYIWLFAMLGVNAFVIVLALAHASNERPDA